MVYPYYCSLLLCFLILFFFFKQKTAYEMRISDWSSDVCSSDLGRRSQAALNYINTTSYRHGKATELDISANLVGDSSQCSNCRADRYALRSVRSIAAKLPLTLMTIWSPAARSEEHTSELQSLMRISYAVFCLKKKNNTQLKQTQYQKNQSTDT